MARLIHGVFGEPASFYAGPDSIGRQTAPSRPFRERERLTKGRYVDSIAAVVLLFLTVRPLTIWRPAVANTIRTFPTRVVALVVNTIKGVFNARSWAHIGKEVGGTTPSLADPDTSPAVAIVIRRPFIEYALAHGIPRAIVNSFVLAVRSRQAPATSRSSCAQAVAAQDRGIAAIAQAFPVVMVPNAGSKARYCQVSITISNEINFRTRCSLFLFGDVIKIVNGHLFSRLELMSRGFGTFACLAASFCV